MDPSFIISQFKPFEIQPSGEAEKARERLALLSSATKDPTPIPKELTSRIAKIKSAEDAASIVREFRALKAGDTVDHQALLVNARAELQAAVRAEIPAMIDQLFGQVAGLWDEVLESVRGLHIATSSTARGQADELIAKDKIRTLSRMVGLLLNRGINAVTLPDPLSGGAWPLLAILTRIPDYPTAHGVGFHWSVEGVQGLIKRADELGFDLKARTRTEAQEALNEWASDVANFAFVGGKLWPKDGTQPSGPWAQANPRKIADAVFRDQLRNA